jgi:prephenate dehydrogenase
MTTAERTLILGAAGGFGRLLGSLLEGEVAGADIAPGAGRLRGDARAPDAALRAELRSAGSVLLCLPEPAALAALDTVPSELPPGALLVDTLSVKTPVVRRLQRLRADLELLSLDPLFAPSVGLAGQNVAAVVVRDGPRGAALLARLEAAGATVLRMTADEHDRAAAGAQVAVHAAVLAYAQARARLGGDPAFSTPPSRALDALVARVLAGAPEVYRHIQADNPYAAEARRALAAGLEEVERHAGDPDGFARLLARLRR